MADGDVSTGANGQPHEYLSIDCTSASFNPPDASRCVDLVHVGGIETGHQGWTMCSHASTAVNFPPPVLFFFFSALSLSLSPSLSLFLSLSVCRFSPSPLTTIFLLWRALFRSPVFISVDLADRINLLAIASRSSDPRCQSKVPRARNYELKNAATMNRRNGREREERNVIIVLLMYNGWKFCGRIGR